MRAVVLLVLGVLLFSSCSKKIFPTRDQFLKDGEVAPTIRLDLYKSVQERPMQDSSTAVAIAISGGGSRAANFGVGVMLGLERIRLKSGRDVLDEIDYLSTVSGGGFAGGSYISALFDHHYYYPRTPFSFRKYTNRYVKEDLAVSYLGALLSAYTNPRVWFSYIDDGDALEKAIDDHVLGYQRRKERNDKRSILLGDLFIAKDSVDKEVLFPMHITNSSVISTFAIFPFTPGILDTFGVVGYTHRMRKVNPTTPSTYDIPLAVGIKSSGSFPVLISNSTFATMARDSRPFLHLMDGAMTDNQGFYTALDILIKDTCSSKVMFIVDADSSGNINTFSSKEAAEPPLRVLGRLTASGIYARRSILFRQIAGLKQALGIAPFVFSFYALIQDNTADPPEEIKIKEEQERLIGLLEKDIHNISDEDMQILYELVINIGTKYTIKPLEQELLHLAGQKVVLMQEAEIRASFE